MWWWRLMEVGITRQYQLQLQLHQRKAAKGT
jgi:hypothetical protein